MVNKKCIICQERFEHDQENLPVFHPTPGESTLKRHIRITHFPNYTGDPLEYITEMLIQGFVQMSVTGLSCVERYVMLQQTNEILNIYSENDD